MLLYISVFDVWTINLRTKDAAPDDSSDLWVQYALNFFINDISIGLGCSQYSILAALHPDYDTWH